MHSERIDIRAHFGLSNTPFTREFRIEHRWSLPFIDQTLAALLQTIEERFCAALFGPPGTGKTVLLRALKDRLPEARYRVSYIKVADLSKRNMCGEIAEAIGCRPAGQYPSLVRALQNHFSQTFHQQSQRPVILLDEAHDIRPDVLPLFRLLTNFEMDSKLVVSILFSGHPKLADLLRREDQSAISRRLNHIANLPLLSREQCRAYVEHRLAIAGARSPLFDSQALDALFEISSGNMRAIDTLALKALYLGGAEKVKVIDPALVVKAKTQVYP